MYALISAVAIEKYPGSCTSLNTKSLCLFCTSARCSVNIIPPPVFRRLRKYLLMSSSCSRPESQPCHTTIAARVFAAHTHSPSFSKCSMRSLCLDVYRALPTFRSLLSQLLFRAFPTVRLASSFIASSLSDVENKSRRKCAKELHRRVSG